MKPSATLPPLPVADIVIIGGTIAAVSAALALNAAGLKVAVVTDRTYLGEDVCDSLRLHLPENTDLSHPLTRRLLGEAAASGASIRPLHIKLELERALREANVPVMLATAPGDIVRDENGEIAGVTVCNRSGRRLLRCRAVLDGTVRGEVARLAGVALTKPDARFEVVRRVIGGEAPANGDTQGAWTNEGEIVFPHGGETRRSTLWAWRAHTSLTDGSWAAWMRLEQETRMLAYRPGQEQAADGIFAFTGEHIRPDAKPVSLDELTDDAICAEPGRLWIAGSANNLDAAGRESVFRADRAAAWGETVAARVRAALRPLRDPASNVEPSVLPAGVEALDIASDGIVAADATFAAVLNVDVLVVGGGTGGAPAGIAAARAGANTLVAEYLAGLGGVGTLGLIGKYWYGNRVGFTDEMDKAVAAKSPRKHEDTAWDIEAKMQWYHEEIARAGGSIWYKTMVCGALKRGNRVVGAVLATPQGRVAVLATCVVDATGGADVAAAAGAETVALGDSHLASQGTGLPPRAPGIHYQNTDYDFIDETDARDVGSAHATAREKFARAFDIGQLVDSRERRRIVGDYEVSPMDIRLARVFPDTINTARSNFDTHGFTVHPLFMIVPPDHDARTGHVPLRALLPRGLDGVLVTGLGISAHRDAMPVIRMQADVQNQGYAAGLLAALTGEKPLRAFDTAVLQTRLVELGILAPGMVTPQDSFPLPEAEIARSIVEAADDPEKIDRVFTLEEGERIERLRAAFAGATTPKARRFYAFVLAMLGDGSGAAELAAEVAETLWDKGWNYRGMHQFGESMSPLDGRIIALGRCRNTESLPVLIEKADTLPADAEFSHYRALAEAFELIGSRDAVPALEKLLARTGITGHARTDVLARVATASADSNENSFRNAALTELHLARALYRIDPENVTGRTILESYREDQRGLFARHAERLLANA